MNAGERAGPSGAPRGAAKAVKTQSRKTKMYVRALALFCNKIANAVPQSP